MAISAITIPSNRCSSRLSDSWIRLIHPLKGLLFRIDGQALTPTYTNKSGKAANGTKTRKRYRYYVSQQAIRQGYGTSALKTISAPLLEDAVRRILVHALPGLAGFVPPDELSGDEIRHRLEMHARHLARIGTPLDFAGWLADAAPRIVVGTGTVAIHLPADRLGKLAGCPPEDAPHPDVFPEKIPVEIAGEGARVILTARVSFKPRRGRSEIVDSRTGEAVAARHTDPNPVLIQTIAQAEFWRMALARYPEKSLREVTGTYGVQPAYVRRLLNAAYLAPAIKKAIFQGTQPSRLQVRDLVARRSPGWRTQLRELGFEDSVAA